MRRFTFVDELKSLAVGLVLLVATTAVAVGLMGGTSYSPDDFGAQQVVVHHPEEVPSWGPRLLQVGDL